MATDLILLGTAGGPTPKPNRAAPAQAVVVDGAIYLVDCGNGVGHQMARAGLALPDLRGLFITHHHSDHNADYASLLLLAWASNLVTPVDTFGPPPLKAMTRSALDLNAFDIATRITDEGRPPLEPLIRPHEVTGPAVIFEDDNVRVTAALVDHPPIETALAYRFDTADRSIVFSGDTAVSPALIELAKGADLLVHECIYLPAIDEMAREDPDASGLREHLEASHTSLDDVGGVAEASGVGTLVLSHLVPSNAGIPDSLWHDRAAQTFSGRVIVGSDLQVL
jgi:ribonuclease BN (tRNA processing enzyme)